MRESEAASDAQMGGELWNFEASRPAAANSVFQSYPVGAAAAAGGAADGSPSSFFSSCFCNGMAWKYVNLPCGSSSRLIIPESTVGGSLLVTIPGVIKSPPRKSLATKAPGLCRSQYCTREGRGA